MKIDEALKSKFENKIIERGKAYFYNRNVLDVVRNYETNDYVGIVKGNYNNEYTVTINNLETDKLEMKCNCPYNGNCKHIYSVLLTIEDKLYQTTKLLPVIESKSYNLKEIIEKIPAEELKGYFMSKFSNMNEEIEIEFKKSFFKYYPLDDYEYYYNNLYNRVMISSKFIYLLDEYSDLMKKYLDGKNYFQVFIIFKSIINVIIQFEFLLNGKDMIVYLNEISIFIRIAYRQMNTENKKAVENYTNEILARENLNIYIEDLITNNILYYRNN